MLFLSVLQCFGEGDAAAHGVKTQIFIQAQRPRGVFCVYAQRGLVQPRFFESVHGGYNQRRGYP